MREASPRVSRQSAGLALTCGLTAIAAARCRSSRGPFGGVDPRAPQVKGHGICRALFLHFSYSPAYQPRAARFLIVRR
jgi:hypothetical protein